MEYNDFKRVFPFGKYLPAKFLGFLATLLPAKKSFKAVTHIKVRDKAEGWIVGIALVPQQIMGLPREKVRQRILAAVRYSQNVLGTDVLMLGTLTSSLTSAGKWLLEQPGIKISITTGNTYTAAITINAVDKIIEYAKFDPANTTLGIVGATGVIGEAVSKHFNNYFKKLVLVGRNKEKLRALSDSIKGNNVKVTDNIDSLIEADIIVTTTSHPEAIIKPDYLKKYAIILDIAEPPDVPKNLIEIRPDVVVIEGGRVKWPDIDLKFNVGLPKGIGFACMTEVIMQALEKKKENHIGSVDPAFLKETIDWGEKYGWTLADFTYQNKPISLERLK